MKGFWTCGPFRESEERRYIMNFRISQMEKFLSILQNLQVIEEQIQSGSEEDQLIGTLIRQDLEKDLKEILGISDDGQEKSSKILGKNILKSFSGTTEN
jgi:hypothetical protein